MKANITHISLQKTGHCISVNINNGSREYNDHYYFTNEEIPFVIKCFRGESKFYPYFSDGSQLIRCTPQGISAIHLNPFLSIVEKDLNISGSFQNSEYIFPGKEFATLLEQFSILEEKEYDCSYKISEWAEKYAPSVKIYWGEGVEETFLKDTNNQIMLSEPAWNPLENLVRIAENNSDGSEMQIFVYFDGYSDDGVFNNYYFEILDPSKANEYDDNGYRKNRIMNGGFIFHKEKDGRFILRSHT